MDELKNKLELYLNDTFEKECVYEIKEAEVQFIKTGIETLMTEIATRVLEDDALQEHMKNTFQKYFEGKLTRSPVNIEGVGSFYEGTKNKFPNEFDFIVVLYCCEGTPEQFKQYLLEASLFVTVIDTFTAIVKEVVERHDFKYTVTGDRQGKSSICFEKHLRFHGPTTWLRFIYENESNQKREIDVDFVAAFKIEDRKMLEHAVKESCALKEFAHQALSFDSCYCIGPNFSFTPTEVHIIKNLLSEGHRKIYRILKYLINGHGDVEKFKKVGKFEKPYSSFQIKTLMIYHHFQCSQSDNKKLGACLLEILDEICEYKTTSVFPSLFKADNRVRLRCDLVLIGQVQSLVETLRYLEKQSGKDYNYERDKVKQSVTKSYSKLTKSGR